jgi:hypothetical protein
MKKLSSIQIEIRVLEIRSGFKFLDDQLQFFCSLYEVHSVDINSYVSSPKLQNGFQYEIWYSGENIRILRASMVLVRIGPTLYTTLKPDFSDFFRMALNIKLLHVVK